MVRHAVAAVMVAGCYHPASEASCSVACVDDTVCPSGLSCIAGLCRSSTSDTCGSSRDGGLVDTPDAPVPSDACPSYGLGLFQTVLCPAGATVTMPASFDTDTDCVPPHAVQMKPNGMTVCVVYGQTVIVTNLTATGSAPLVLAADSLQLSGTLDVSGRFGGNSANGAGSSFDCLAVSGSGDPGVGGPGGAAGGAGGAGGASNSQNPAAGPAARQLTQLQGGCPGTAGDNSDPTHGIGGPGGGVLYLIGRTELVLANNLVISAGGAHGEGGLAGTFGGGGGGGAGGLIGFDSPNMIVGSSIALCANGGGGGGGGAGPLDMPSTQAGSPGQDGCTAFPAMGGGPGGSGGHGGAGSDGGTLSGMDGHAEGANNDSAGGGGGGGGAGYIYVTGNITATMLDMAGSVTPPAQ